MKTIFAFLIFSSCAFAQDGRYGTSTGTSGAITTVTAREKTGWTSNGTTAQDTLATVYRLDKANIRFIVTDADGDTLWFYPQNLLPFVLKDGSTILAAIDSSGRAGFGTSTSGQATRAALNVASRAGADTAVVVTSESNYGLGDSTLYVHGNANVQSGARAGFGVNTSGQAARAILNAASRAGGDSLLVLTAESNYGVGDSSIIVHGDAVMQSGARAGFGAATKGQATRAYLNVLRRSGADTLALLIGDGDGAPGDSTMYALVNGQVSLRGAPYSTYTLTVGGSQCITAANYEVGNGGNGQISNNSGGGTITIYGGGSFGGGVDWLLGSGNKTNRAWWYRASASPNDTLHTLVGGSTNRGYALAGRYTRPYIHTQAFYTIRPYALSDTLFMVRNDNNTALDSTVMVFANGKISYTADPVVAELYVTDNSGGTPETYGTSYIKCAQFTTVGDTARMTAAGDSLTCQVPGTYAVSTNISFSGTGSTTFYVEIRKNSAAIAGARFVRKLGTGGDVGNASCQAVTTLVAGDDISIHVKADDTSKDFLIHEGNLRAMILR